MVQPVGMLGRRLGRAGHSPWRPFSLVAPDPSARHGAILQRSGRLGFLYLRQAARPAPRNQRPLPARAPRDSLRQTLRAAEEENSRTARDRDTGLPHRGAPRSSNVWIIASYRVRTDTEDRLPAGQLVMGRDGPRKASRSLNNRVVRLMGGHLHWGRGCFLNGLTLLRVGAVVRVADRWAALPDMAVRWVARRGTSVITGNSAGCTRFGSRARAVRFTVLPMAAYDARPADCSEHRHRTVAWRLWRRP